MKRKQVEKKWRSEGFSIQSWIDPPGQVWSDMIHETDERLFVVDGQIEVDLNGSLQELHPGDEMLIPAKTIHSIRNSGPHMARWLYGLKYTR